MRPFFPLLVLTCREADIPQIDDGTRGNRVQLGLDAFSYATELDRLDVQAVKPRLVRRPVKMALWLSVWETRGESGGVRDHRLRSVFHAASAVECRTAGLFQSLPSLWRCLPGYWAFMCHGSREAGAR